MIGASMRGLVVAAAVMSALVGGIRPGPLTHHGRPPVAKRRTAKNTHGGQGKARRFRGTGLLQCGTTKGMRQ